MEERINDLGNKISKLEYSHIPEFISVFYEWSENEGKPMYLNDSSDDEIEEKFHEYFKNVFLPNHSYVGTKGGRRKSRKSKRTKKQRKSRKQRK